jgi:hypothetical protein
MREMGNDFSPTPRYLTGVADRMVVIAGFINSSGEISFFSFFGFFRCLRTCSGRTEPLSVPPSQIERPMVSH